MATDNRAMLEAMQYYDRMVSGKYPKKLKKLEGNINNTDIVIVYGDVKGNVNNCDNVIVINGDVYGNISNCDNVAGLLADKAVRCHVGGADE